mmetsp:Transcript_5266/g.13253  ORF Transcript_5266/g.13253 Transcript_5266/m.13253 type:complete len:257 (-) Transcript_5266:127-897(-)
MEEVSPMEEVLDNGVKLRWKVPPEQAEAILSERLMRAAQMAEDDEDGKQKEPILKDFSVNFEKKNEGEDKEEEKEAIPATQDQIDAANKLKEAGNALYLAGSFEEGVAKYTEGIELLPPGTPVAAFLYANRAACHMQTKNYSAVVSDCSAALKIDPKYAKALARRAAANEALDRLDSALEDYKTLVSIEGAGSIHATAVARLTPIVQQRHEQMKDEALGKLKDLGNSLLSSFGMSLDSFQMKQDPTTGSYSISMKP